MESVALEIIEEFCAAVGRMDQYRAYKLLLSDNPDSSRVRNWVNRNSKRAKWGKVIGRKFVHQPPISLSKRLGAPYDSWELQLFVLAGFLRRRPKLSGWDRLPSERRRAHARKLSRLARELSCLIDKDEGPGYPDALYFFNKDAIWGLFSSLSGFMKEHLVSFYDESVVDYEMIKYFAEKEGAIVQDLSDLLNNLAEFAEASVNNPRVDARPNTGCPGARIVTRSLSEYFERQYDRRPNETIAACIRLMYPELEPPPGEQTIREWRGAK